VTTPRVPTRPLDEQAFSFGTFRLYRARKQLLEDGRPVRLGSRALDILIALVERAGELVGKDELVAFVWPRTIVEESSLRVHVAALRKVLGDGQAGARYILNQPGRGYSFIAPVTRVREPRDAIAYPAADDRLSRFPARLTRMLGRAESVAILASQLKIGRYVTLVGPGGIGKTTLALAVAEEQGLGYEHGVCFIDLAPIVNARLIPAALMAGLGLVGPRADGLHDIVAAIRGRRMLLVFDNCEHVVDELALLVEHLLKAAPGLHVLATSREPMRAEGEWLHRLGSLAAPPASTPLTASEALRFPAVELFVERATASVDDFSLRDQDAAVVGDLCRRLDGNPLAIELAAARVDLFGLQGLSKQLDAHILQLKGIRRDAPTRHHTIATMLDWSYRLLTDVERLILNRLAIFQGWFPLSAATELVMAIDPPDSLRPDEVSNGIANLAAKSLLTSDASGEIVQFRLLELTRAYSLAQLDLLGQRSMMANRHAVHVLSLLRTAAADWTVVSKREWHATYTWLMNDVRAALAWSFAGEGDPLTGCTLTAAVWSLVNVLNPFDQPDAIERALAALAKIPGPHPALEMRLTIALATKFELVEGRTAEANAANARALLIAEQVDSPELEAEALMGIVIVTMAHGDYVQASNTLGRLNSAARRSGSAIFMLVADRIGSQVSHLAGFHAKSRALAERVLNHPAPRGPMGTISGGLDHGVSMRIMLTRVLWIEGFADQAASLAEETLQLASREDTLALCQTFSLCACPVALWRGDIAVAAKRTDEFRSLAASHITGGVWLPTSAVIPWWLTESSEGVTSVLQLDHLITVRSSFITPGAVARAASGEAGWCAPELLRAHGERLLLEGTAGAVDAAQERFQQSLAIAAQQHALAWELRSATSLARLWQRQGRASEARDLLAPVYRRFTEGFDTADLLGAAALLTEL